LEKTTGTTLHALPVPSVFIVDRSGVIRYVYSNPDFRVRLHADALWEAAAPFAPRKQPNWVEPECAGGRSVLPVCPRH